MGFNENQTQTMQVIEPVASIAKPELMNGSHDVIQSLIAEGVETEYQLTRLREAGIQVAQGFYFSRPIPPGALIAYHRDRNGQ